MGTPAAPPMISLAEAAATAQKQMHNHPTTSASQAAKKLEESRARPAELTGAQPGAVSAVGHHDAARAKAPTPVTRPAISTASAAAAAFEANMIGKRKKAQPSVNATPSGSQQPKGTTWTDSKPFRPNAREPAAIEVDYSWTRTGGNAWSNKYRLDLPKTAQGTVNGWSQPQQHVHQQQTHKHHQAQHPHQTQRQQQQPQHHQRHYSVPVHPTHQAQPRQAQPRQAQPQQNPAAAWRGWGREGVEMQGTYTDSDEETTNGWNYQHGGDEWGRNSGGWTAQQPAGKHNKTHGQRRKSEDRREQANGWGQQQQQPMKDHWAQTNDGWGQDQWGQGGGGGDAWGKEGGDAWGQGGGGGDGWGQGGGAADGWGKGAGGGDAWGQGGGRGGGGGADAWGKGAADGWGEGGDAWGQQAQGGETGWGNTPQHGWGSQAEGAGRASLNNEWGGTTQAKVKFTAAEAAGSRNAVSPQQRSQILNSLLNNQPQTQNNHAAQLSAAAHAAQVAATAKYQAQMKAHQTQQAHQAHQAHHQERREAWEAEESSDGWGSDEDEEGEHNRRVHFSPKWSEVWGGSPRSIPTKALAHAHAQQGIKTTLINDASNVRFAESKGAAFAHVADAFFGNVRLARERIHWLFSPNKDKRVEEMLAWVQKMSFNLGTYGVRYPHLLTSHLDTYN